MKAFLRVGEFARLCGTTKDTILHYTRKGILKPHKIARSGYRYYSTDQFWEFRLLALLKETGSSISEIAGSCGQSCLEFIKGKLSDLAAHRDNLTQRIDMLSKMIALTEEVNCSPADVPIPDEMPPRMVRYHEINPDDMELTLDNPDAYSSCLKKDLEFGNTVYPPLGFVIPAQNAICGNLRVAYIFSECGDMNLPGSKLIAGGQCVKMIHYGDMVSHRSCFRNLIDDMIRKGLRPAGDVLIYDQMNFLLAYDDDKFWGKYVAFFHS